MPGSNTNSGHRRPGRRAFTLVELVVSMSVGVIISGVAGSLLWNAARQHSEIVARGELTDMAGGALEMLVRHVRETTQGGPLGSPNGQAIITTASATQMNFARMDPDAGVSVANGFRRNTSAGTLEMTIDNGATWRTMATDVSALAFAYFNRSGQDLSTLAAPDDDPVNTRRVQITLTLARGAEVATVRTSVFLRNFMNEVDLAPPP